MTSHYVVSDVHGHLDDLLVALASAGLVDGDRRWSGGTDQLWVLGDLFDRGPDGVGTLRLLRDLQPQAAAAGGSVEVLLGNHEVLALGMRWFGDAPVPAEPERSFGASWERNEGQPSDQRALTDDDVAWLVERPAVAVSGEWLLLHSDGPCYLHYGDSPAAVNAAFADVLASRDHDRMWRLWASMTSSRFAFVGDDGVSGVHELVEALGGSRVAHGHTIIADLLEHEDGSDDAPLAYAEGTALGIDGGRYDGGPLLVVRLEDHQPTPAGR